MRRSKTRRARAAWPAAAASVLAALLVGAPTAAAQAGACTDAVRAAYADGGGHDHFNLAQHRVACGLEQVSFSSLKKELAARPDIVTGETDIENGLAAVAVAYPESGFLLFDVRNPARPVFLSWARSKACEGLAIDVDCGAYVDLSEDGKVAFVSTQQITVVPNTPNPGAPAPAIPGVEVFDVSDPSAPQLTQTQPVASEGGVHTANSTVIDGGPNPGEYLFATANAFGIEVQRVDRTGVPKVVPVARIDIPEVHDMFLQRDPLTGKTLMYVAAGFTSGFYVYDVTDPTNAQLLAEWDLTPQCPDDWYSHTIDVTTVNGRRILTMPAELFDNGTSSNQACGKTAGNGDKPGPLWFVDITNLGGLGQPGDSDDVLRRKSEAALITTWTNPADRPAGPNSRFSPHNQQIVGDRVYMSNYHGGVVALDASAALRGERVRPQEVGAALPSDPTDPRPVFKPTVAPASPFITGFLSGRPLVWDTLFYRGYLIVPDMLGGITSYLPTARGTGGAAPTPGTEQPSQTGGPLPSVGGSGACLGREGFSSVAVRPAGRGLRFAFARRVARPVTIDVFRVSAGRRVTGERLVARFAQAIADLADEGHQIIVVHGGGAALTRTLQDLGRESQFIDGLRVTDNQTRDVALMVLAGQLNKQLVAAVGHTGKPAIGICGGDLQIFQAAKKRGKQDLGFVGQVCRVDSNWLNLLWKHGAIPVVSSIALGVDGEYYNINADEMACVCAVACNADALIFLTDVAGVKDGSGEVIRWLDVKLIDGMKQAAIVSGGMLPKLEACTTALRRGVGRVRILPASQVDVLPGFFSHSIQQGTEVIQ